MFSRQLTIKGLLFKENPFPFHAVTMAPHGREMSQDLRKKIIYLHKKGEGYKTISKALLISQNTVAKVVQTFKKDGTATISQRRPGHPRKLTPRQERLLMRRVEENRHASSLQLSKEVESQTGVTISRDTIQRTLQRNGMHGCHPQKKPLLKPRHKKAPIEFARAHADKDEDYWDSILWSDEILSTCSLAEDPDPAITLDTRLNIGLRKRAMRIQDFVKAVTPQSQQTNNASQQRSQKKPPIAGCSCDVTQQRQSWRFPQHHVASETQASEIPVKTRRNHVG